MLEQEYKQLKEQFGEIAANTLRDLRDNKIEELDCAALLSPAYKGFDKFSVKTGQLATFFPLFCDALKNNTSVKKFTLRYRKLSKEESIQLADALNANHSICDLDLRESEFPAEFWQKGISKNSFSLDNSHTSINNEKLVSITSALKNNLLVSLDISFCKFLDIDDQAFKDFTDALGKNKSLKNLNLGYIKLELNEERERQFAQAIGENDTISNLNLSGIETLSGRGIQLLCKAIESKESLKDLSLNKYTIDDETASSIGNMLARNHSLKAVDLNNNILSENGKRNLALGLMQKDNLLAVDLGCAYDYTNGSIHIVNALKNLKSLCSVVLELEPYANFQAINSAKVTEKLVDSNERLLVVAVYSRTGYGNIIMEGAEEENNRIFYEIVGRIQLKVQKNCQLFKKRCDQMLAGEFNMTEETFDEVFEHQIELLKLRPSLAERLEINLYKVMEAYYSLVRDRLEAEKHLLPDLNNIIAMQVSGVERPLSLQPAPIALQQTSSSQQSSSSRQQEEQKEEKEEKEQQKIETTGPGSYEVRKQNWLNKVEENAKAAAAKSEGYGK